MPAGVKAETQRLPCGFCLRTLDSNDPDPVRRAVTACPGCGRRYHQSCAPMQCVNPNCQHKGSALQPDRGQFLPARIDDGQLQPAPGAAMEVDPVPRALHQIPPPAIWAVGAALLVAVLTDGPAAPVVSFLLGCLFIVIHQELRQPPAPFAVSEWIWVWRVRRAVDEYRRMQPASIAEACLLVLFLIIAFKLAVAICGAAALAILLWCLDLWRRPVHALDAWSRQKTRADEWLRYPVVAYLLSFLCATGAVGLNVWAVRSAFGPASVPLSRTSLAVATVLLLAAAGIGIRMAHRQPARLAWVTFWLCVLSLLSSIFATAIALSWQLDLLLPTSNPTWNALMLAAVVVLLLGRRFLACGHEFAPGKATPIMMALLAFATPVVLQFVDQPGSRALSFALIAAAVIVAVKPYLKSARSGLGGGIPEWALLHVAVAVALLLASYFTMLGQQAGLLISAVPIYALWRIALAGRQSRKV